jgi:protein SCO1/2
MWLPLLLLISAPPEPPSRLAVIRPAPPLALTTEDDKPLNAAELRGRVLLVTFFFTTCNGTCPATTSRLARVHQELKTRGLGGDRVHLLSVTLDPERDTPAALRRYRQLYDLEAAPWSFLTGPPERVRRVMDDWGIWAKPAANGQLDHPSRVYLVDGRGRIREIYGLDFLRPAWVAEDVQLLLTEEAKATHGPTD